MADGWGISRAEADNIGMLGTVMNALMLRGALTARTVTDVRVMTAMPIQSVAEPFIRLRAVRHLEHGLIVLLAGGIGQPYVTTDYPAVQRTLELDARSEEHTSELQSQFHLVCRLLLEKKKNKANTYVPARLQKNMRSNT